jgi:Fe/S biogenesis protein NfuA
MTTAPLTIDDDAAHLIRAALEPGDGLHVSITGAERGQYTYDLVGTTPDDTTPDTTARFTANGIAVSVDAHDETALRGAALTVRNGQLVIVNPNRPPRGGAVVPDGLVNDDALSDTVRDVIDTLINPNLDAHGGSITYVGHDTRGGVHVAMHGGCAGCSMANSTMFDGVERVLAARVDGVERVVDVTDHASGAAPYYR